MREPFLVQGLTSLCFLSCLSVASADTETFTDLKPTGVSVEWYQHELDLKVTDIKTSLPGITSAMVDSVKGSLDTTDNVKLVNIRLDYQLRPYLNVYGSIGKITDNTSVDFSKLGLGISDLVVDSKGTAYTAGAILVGKYGKLIPALQYIHSNIDLEGNASDITLDALIPSLGVQTNYGVFDASLVYQALEAEYSGTVSAPFVGEVPLTVNAENKDNLQVMAGWHTQLAKDLYLHTNVGLNGHQQFQLMLNKRF